MSKIFQYTSPKKKLTVTAIIDDVQTPFTGLERLTFSIKGEYAKEFMEYLSNKVFHMNIEKVGNVPMSVNNWQWRQEAGGGPFPGGGFQGRHYGESPNFYPGRADVGFAQFVNKSGVTETRRYHDCSGVLPSYQHVANRDEMVTYSAVTSVEFEKIMEVFNTLAEVLTNFGDHKRAAVQIKLLAFFDNTCLLLLPTAKNHSFHDSNSFNLATLAECPRSHQLTSDGEDHIATFTSKSGNFTEEQQAALANEINTANALTLAAFDF